MAVTATMTITEALAELKTIKARLLKKRQGVMPYVWRQEGLKDPMAAEVEGGSVAYVERERQAIKDLEDRYVKIRTAIQKRNLETELTVEGVTRNVQEWLNWRKEIATDQGKFTADLLTTIDGVRKNATAKGWNVMEATAGGDKKYQDVVVNLGEKALREDHERHDTILGVLDGQLSLKIATVTIEV